MKYRQGLSSLLCNNNQVTEAHCHFVRTRAGQTQEAFLLATLRKVLGTLPCGERLHPPDEAVSKYQDILKSFAWRHLSEIQLAFLSCVASPKLNRLYKQWRLILLGTVESTKHRGRTHLVNCLTYNFSTKHFPADFVHSIPSKIIGIMKSFNDFPSTGGTVEGVAFDLAHTIPSEWPSFLLS